MELGPLFDIETVMGLWALEVKDGGPVQHIL